MRSDGAHNCVVPCVVLRLPFLFLSFRRCWKNGACASAVLCIVLSRWLFLLQRGSVSVQRIGPASGPQPEDALCLGSPYGRCQGMKKGAAVAARRRCAAASSRSDFWTAGRWSQRRTPARQGVAWLGRAWHCGIAHCSVSLSHNESIDSLTYTQRSEHACLNTAIVVVIRAAVSATVRYIKHTIHSYSGYGHTAIRLYLRALSNAVS